MIARSTLVTILCFALGPWAAEALAQVPAGQGEVTQANAATSTLASSGVTPFNLDHRPEYGGIYSGVARLQLGSTGCSGALLADGIHLLTAAHCVAPNGVFSFSSGTASFATTPDAGNPFTGSMTTLTIASALAHPGWTGDFNLVGNDLAVLTLASVAPAQIPRYSLYSGNADVGAVFTKVGWGTTGNGLSAATGPIEWRVGQNLYDTNQSFIETTGPSSILVYDFDDGTVAHDLLSRFGYSDLGLGTQESMIGLGDSGGPSFINGQIAGVTSFRWSFGVGFGDIDSAVNSTFGEMGGDTRVTAFSSWISSAVPENSTWAMLLLGLLTVGQVARRRHH